MSEEPTTSWAPFGMRALDDAALGRLGAPVASGMSWAPVQLQRGGPDAPAEPVGVPAPAPPRPQRPRPAPAPPRPPERGRAASLPRAAAGPGGVALPRPPGPPVVSLPRPPGPRAAPVGAAGPRTPTVPVRLPFEPLAFVAILVSFFFAPFGLALAFASLSRAGKTGARRGLSVLAILVAGVATLVNFGILAAIVESFG